MNSKNAGFLYEDFVFWPNKQVFYWAHKKQEADKDFLFLRIISK
jgi:hypothetical protein